jgi:hypothetical protein
MDAPITGNRVAASLAPHDTAGCLRELERLAPRIGMAEVRLDLMRTFDMVDRYALHLVNADTKVYVHVISTDRQYQEVLSAQEKAARGAELHVSLTVADADSPAVAGLVVETLPHVSVEVGARA